VVFPLSTLKYLVEGRRTAAVLRICIQHSVCLLTADPDPGGEISTKAN
jgi:hypothetical protein